MKFNLNEFLCAVSNTLDIIEIELFGMPTNHSKRIAYISIKIAKQLHLSDEQVFDLASLAILHDNGASLKMLHDQLIGTTKEKFNLMEARKEHCMIGDDNLVAFPFFTNPKHVILYHHEKFDGSGFFGLKQDEIPLMSQIIALSDTLDLSFDLRNAYERKEDIQAFVLSHKGTYFAPQLCDIFISISSDRTFWNDLSDDAIDDGIDRMIPDLHVDFSFDEIRTITKTFSRIIDAKSTFTQKHSQGLSDKIANMAKYYHLDADLTQKLIIAADLHDLGKLAVSNQILDKPGKLTASEYEQIKNHPRVAQECLQHVNGFEEIATWIGNHHEKLDGSGYPNGLKAPDIDFYSRLITCLDIYQALREIRPYRKSMDHDSAIAVMNEMVAANLLDGQIVKDIDGVLHGT